jgi:hypothetical protein
LGTVIAHKETLPIEIVLRAKNCWDKAIIFPTSPSKSNGLCYKGLYNYYSIYKDLIEKHIEKLADELLRHYNINLEVNCWYEDYMTYANNVLPEAMMYSYLLRAK